MNNKNFNVIFVSKNAQTVLQHLAYLTYMLQKNKQTEKDCMNSSNNNNYMSKNYLNVFTIVLAEIGSV